MPLLQKIHRRRRKKPFRLVHPKCPGRMVACSITVNQGRIYITTRHREIKIPLSEVAEFRDGPQSSDRWIELYHRIREKQRRRRPTRSGSPSKKIDDCIPFSILLPQNKSILPHSYDFGVDKRFQDRFNDLRREFILERDDARQRRLRDTPKRIIEEYYEINIKNIINEPKNCDRDSPDNNRPNSLAVRKFIPIPHGGNTSAIVDRTVRLIRHINLRLEGRHLTQILKEQDAIKGKADFLQLMDRLDQRPFFNFLFYKYSNMRTNRMFIEDLRKFFQEEQFETPTDSELLSMMARYGQVSAGGGGGGGGEESSTWFLDRIGFYRLLDSDDGQRFDLFDPQHRAVCQDMSRPMTDYFIASSHNSYLTGNQLSSNSSYEMYRMILRTGCRCIEIDVWDNDNDAEQPLVYHGYTMTSRIQLEGVLHTINESAFETSDYPVVISVENRCKNPASHSAMAKMMCNIFGRRLFLISNDDQTIDTDRFPSPADVRGRIFIKCSKNESNDQPDTVDLDDLFDVKIPLLFGRTLLIMSRQQRNRHRESIKRHHREKIQPNQGAVIIRGDVEEDIDQTMSWKFHWQIQRRRRHCPNLEDQKQQNRKSNHNWDESFSRLINYFQTRKFQDINQCLEEFKFYQMISRDEKQSRELIEKHPDEYRQFTRGHMVRVYPAGWRQDSSNYMPVDHWEAGAQMVALNYQRLSMPLFLNQALFALNGGCGYVLKPERLRQQQPNDRATVGPTRLKIRILCGQFWNHFRRKKIQLKVIIRIYSGVAKYRQFTNQVENGFNPLWDETFEFDLDQPELSFIHFTLTNCDVFFGQYLIAFPAMRQGFRHIPLMDREQRPIKYARLFLSVEKQQQQQQEQWS